MFKSKKQREIEAARAQRLDEVTALLMQSDALEFYDDLKPWQMQLLAKLQGCGITKTDDLNTPAARELVVSGLEIDGMPENQSYFQYICQTGDERSQRIRLVDEQSMDRSVTDKRFGEIRYLLQCEAVMNDSRAELAVYQDMYRRVLDLERNGADAAEQKRVFDEIRVSPFVKHELDRAEEAKGPLTTKEVLHQLDKKLEEILPKVHFSPVNMMLLEAVHEHGIRDIDELYKPQNAMWVMRGMKGSFVETQAQLQPTQAFSDLGRGLTQEEISRSIENEIIAKVSARFKENLRRVGTSEERPMDVEYSAIMALNGFHSAEELDSAAGREFILRSKEVFKDTVKGYNGEGNAMTRLNEDGFPDVYRSDDVRLMLSGYRQNGRFPTVSEIRTLQAKNVMEKVLAGQPLEDWETVVYASLAAEKVVSLDDLEKSEVKQLIENGLKNVVQNVPSAGFGALQVSDLKPQAAFNVARYKEELNRGFVPEKLSADARLTPEQVAGAPNFAAEIETAFRDFENGRRLSHMQEELIAISVARGLNSAKEALANMINPVRSSLAVDMKLRDAVAQGHNLETGDAEAKIDEHGFIKNKEYEPGMKEFILKLRQAEQAPVGKRKMPERVVSAKERVNNVRAFADVMSGRLKTVEEAPKPLSKGDAEKLRLQEVTDLLQKCDEDPEYLSNCEKNEEVQLFSVLQMHGITSAQDLKNRSKRNAVKAGLGLAGIANKGFKQHIVFDKQVINPQLANETVCYKRFMEASMIMEKFGDHDHLTAQLDGYKEAYYASLDLQKPDVSEERKAECQEILKAYPETAIYTGAKLSEKLLKQVEDLIPLAVPTPTECLVYEAMRAHGIQKSDDLLLPQNEFWVRGGMPGTFIEKQVKLTPDQSFGDLQYGLSQEEIMRNKAKDIAKHVTDAVKGSLTAVQEPRCLAADVEKAAALACLGIRSVEELTSPKGQELLSDSVAWAQEVTSGYGQDGVPNDPDARGFPKKERGDDLERMINGYLANGKFPSMGEVRVAQAEAVLNKIISGKPLAEWEDALYAGLAMKGIVNVEALQNPEKKKQVEEGLKDVFTTETEHGFNAHDLSHLSSAAAHQVMTFRANHTEKTQTATDRIRVMKDFAKVMERIDLYEARVEKPRMAAKQRAAEAQKKVHGAAAVLKGKGGRE